MVKYAVDIGWVTQILKEEAVFENQSAFDVIITDSNDPVGPACVLFETPF